MKYVLSLLIFLGFATNLQAAAAAGEGADAPIIKLKLQASTVDLPSDATLEDVYKTTSTFFQQKHIELLQMLAQKDALIAESKRKGAEGPTLQPCPTVFKVQRLCVPGLPLIIIDGETVLSADRAVLTTDLRTKVIDFLPFNTSPSPRIYHLHAFPELPPRGERPASRPCRHGIGVVISTTTGLPVNPAVAAAEFHAARAAVADAGAGGGGGAAAGSGAAAPKG